MVPWAYRYHLYITNHSIYLYIHPPIYISKVSSCKNRPNNTNKERMRAQGPTHTTRKKVYYNGKYRCNNYKVVAIRCYCNGKKVVASRCNKLRGNRSTQHKDLVAINSTYCNKQVDAITSLLQQIIWWQ